MLGATLWLPVSEAQGDTKEPEIETEEVIRLSNVIQEEPARIEPDSFPEVEIIEEIEIPPVATPDDIEEEIYWDSLELLALCIEAEAGNQSQYGKRLVCDVVLNRTDDPDFPNTIWDVIMQPHQFTVVSNGSIYKVDPSEETFQVVREELENRTNDQVLFFTSEGYSAYGKSWEKVEAHYFSVKR